MAAALQPVRLSGRMQRLMQGTGDLRCEPWARPGAAVEVALGPDEPPPEWDRAVAVYLNGRRLGWVNGGGEAMRGHLRRAWAAGWYVVVPGAVEIVQGAPSVRLSAPWPAALNRVEGVMDEIKGAQVRQGTSLTTLTDRGLGPGGPATDTVPPLDSA